MKARDILGAPQPLAVESGVEIFERGGKAIDAAVGAAFVQGGIGSSMTSLGGFGTMLIYSGATRKVYGGFFAHPSSVPLFPHSNFPLFLFPCLVNSGVKFFSLNPNI